MLHFVNFQKLYNGYPALAIEDFTIGEGIYWIKGVNGSGKSTLLKSIAGILSFDGDISLQNISIKKQPVEYRKFVNFAEAEPLFPEFLTGMEIIKLFTAAKNGPFNQEKDYLESMSMSAYINNPVGTYSSGMLKKLSLVLAFLGKPKLILLDEPLITIDAAAVDVLYQWIKFQQQEHGTSFLLSSHQIFDQGLLPAQQLLVADQTLKRTV